MFKVALLLDWKDLGTLTFRNENYDLNLVLGRERESTRFNIGCILDYKKMSINFLRVVNFVEAFLCDNCNGSAKFDNN